MQKFKAAGVNVNAAWLDWEVEPYPGKSQWREARDCKRCQKQFPAGVLDNYDLYRAFITRLHNNLFSTYFAAPILEVYPQCSVTNWEAVLSSTEIPTTNWSGRRKIPATGIGLFTATNPVAYGNTIWYRYSWKEERGWPLDVAHMDRVYTEVMLAEISDNEANIQRYAPEIQSIPWVDRYCVDDNDEKIPILSRERYREILRHCWLRGADGMQIFNNAWFRDRPDRMNIVTEEVEDAVAIYDEMLGYRDLLDNGTVMNTVSPKAEDNGPIWSGLRYEDEAVIRTFTQSNHTATLTVTAFPGTKPVKLKCPPEGATYLLTKRGGNVDVAVKK